MQVRPATRADVEAVYDLHVASIRAFGQETYDDRQVTAWAETEYRGPDEHYPVGEPGHHFVVARVARPEGGPRNRAARDASRPSGRASGPSAREQTASETSRELAGELAGFGHLAVEDREVQAVYVHPEHAQAGVGSALLAHLEGVAYGLGLSELTLTASLNAVPFYEAAGYERVREDVHTTRGGGVEAELDVVVMRKVLPPTPEL